MKLKTIMMIGAIVCTVSVMIVSLTCPVYSSYKEEYGRIDGVGSVYNKGSSSEHSLAYGLGMDDSTVIAIIVVFSFVTIAGILFLMLVKRTSEGMYFFIATIAMFGSMIPLVLDIVCLAANKGGMSFIGGSDAVGGSVYGSGTSLSIEGGSFAIIFLSVLEFVAIAVYMSKTYKEKTGLSQKQIEKAKAEVTEDNWLS